MYVDLYRASKGRLIMREGKTRPTVIGLCGRSGSGKGFLSTLFGEIGVPAIDTDKVYRDLTGASSDGRLTPCVKELVLEFGESILKADGSLDRGALAEIVFAPGESDRLKRLNEIAHKHILRETDRRIHFLGDCGHDIVIVDAPVLFESGYDKKCDTVIAAVAPDEVVLRRIMERDGISERDAMRRLGVQMPNSEFERRADHVINTDRCADFLRIAIKETLELIRQGKE